MALLTGRAVLDRHGDLLDFAPCPPGEPPDGEPGPGHGQRVVGSAGPRREGPGPRGCEHLGACRHGWQRPPGAPRGPGDGLGRPPPGSSHALPPGPNPSARTPSGVTGADTVQRVPSHQAASRLFPVASSAALPPGMAVRPSTRTVPIPGPPAGSVSPADRQVPPVSVKTPAAPGRTQLPAAI